MHRRDEFRSEKVLTEKVKNNSKIELVLNSVVTDFYGEQKLEGITVSDKQGNEQKLAISGCFEEIGRIPNTEFLDNIEKTVEGYIVVDEDCKTNVDGIYACGDVVNKKIRQIATAVNDGAIAGLAISNYLG